MGCSGVGWLDSLILGINHLYITGNNVGPTATASFGFDPEAAAAEVFHLKNTVEAERVPCRAW